MARIARGDVSSTRLYIGHLSNTTREAEVEDEFLRFGRIRDVHMKHGFAFVEFYDPRDADNARSRMDGRVIHGSQWLVQFARVVPRRGGPGRGGGSGRFGDEGRDAFYDDRSRISDGNFGLGPRNRSRDLSPDRYRNDRGFNERYIVEADAQYINSGYSRGGAGPIPIGGQGGGRERGGRPDVCYNCGQEGHIARECREGDWRNRCYTCGQYGHVKRECPGRGSRSRRSRSAYRSRSRSPRETIIRRRSGSRSRSRSLRETIIRRRSRSRSPDTRIRRSRNAPSPDSYIDFRRSSPGDRRRSQRSPSDDNRRRHSPSPDYRRSRSRSPSDFRRNRRLPEYGSKPNDNTRERSPPREHLSEIHEDNDGGASPIQRAEHRSPAQRDHDGGVSVVPYTTDSDNDEQNRRSRAIQDEEVANNPTETSHHEDDPVNEDEDMTVPASINSPRDEAAHSPQETSQKNSGAVSESD